MPKLTQAQGTSCFEKIVVWPLLVDFGYFSNYIWLQAAQEPTNPAHFEPRAHSRTRNGNTVIKDENLKMQAFK